YFGRFASQSAPCIPSPSKSSRSIRRASRTIGAQAARGSMDSEMASTAGLPLTASWSLTASWALTRGNAAASARHPVSRAAWSTGSWPWAEGAEGVDRLGGRPLLARLEVEAGRRRRPLERVATAVGDRAVAADVDAPGAAAR